MNPDLKVVAALWNRSYPARFRLDEATLSNLIGVAAPSMEGARFSCDNAPQTAPVEFHGQAVVLKRSGTPALFPGQDPERGHVALWATDLPWDCTNFHAHLEWARQHGIKRITFGMDPDHILPGVPDDMPRLIDELAAHGFEEIGRCFDLERDLADYEAPASCHRALADSGASVRPGTTQDSEELDAYFARVFPGRWRYDVMRKVRVDQEPDQVYVLIFDGKIAGHAMTQSQGCKRPVCGAVWHLSLGPSWGALGSIGIAPEVRGKGLGNALLGMSLLGLRERGARQTIIDWTTLTDFYGAHGFEVTRQYSQMMAKLD